MRLPIALFPLLSIFVLASCRSETAHPGKSIGIEKYPEASTFPAASGFSRRPSPATKMEPSASRQMAVGRISSGNVLSSSPRGE
ncbi:MAG TPA: hypothetical protein PKA41_12945 [Verrucomicrobiota bacterium]|nr:hypothetical protein [Verrucomicrobiota bacterium]